jgi:two-component system NtrC family response regulator
LPNGTLLGNSEVENKIGAVSMLKGIRVKPEEPEIRDGGKRQTVRLKDAREALERKMVFDTLARNRNNMTRSAEELGISRPTLYDLMEKLGIPWK